MYELKNKTEGIVKDSKELLNDALGEMFKSGSLDVFGITDDETGVMMNMLKRYIALSNKLFDLAIAQAEALDNMNEKLDKLSK